MFVVLLLVCVVMLLDTADHSCPLLVKASLVLLGMGLWSVQSKVVLTPLVQGLLYI